MINQLPLYLLCFAIGWVPLYFLYRKVEQMAPFPLKQSTVVFSIMPFLYIIYLSLEVFRGYFLMFILHEWLAYDMDLLVGLGLWLVGIGFPFLIPKQYRTSLWLSIWGIYWYLFPLYFWTIPLILVTLFFIRASKKVSYGLTGVFFIFIGWLQGGNSLYMSVYVGLFLYLLIKTFPLEQKKGLVI